MRRLVTFLSMFLLAGGAALAQPMPPQPTLTVTGSGSVARVPDTASLAVGLQTVEPTAAEAQQKNNAAFAAIKAALGKIGVSADNVRSERYDLRYNPPPQPVAGERTTESIARNPGVQYGYIINRGVTVVGLDPARVGDAVDAAASGGATELSGITFSIRDRNGAHAAAQAAAIADAAAQAKALATAAHVRLGNIVHIDAGSGGGIPGGPIAFRMAAPATQIAPSDVEVSASVTITYAIGSIP
jgi:uncharacterized protein YggE